jgi:hypothetical protein
VEISCIIPSSTATRLAQLLLLLSSDKDGEITNAARAIGQTLNKAGCDWHDLTATLLAQPPQTKALPNDNNDWRSMRQLCIEHQNLLRPHELEFVISLDHWRGNLTTKQRDWLIAIYARLQRAAA